MAGEVVVDALPYIDQGYDEPGVREAVSHSLGLVYILLFMFYFLSYVSPLKYKNSQDL